MLSGNLGIQYYGVMAFFRGKYYGSTGRWNPMDYAPGRHDRSVSFDRENNYWGKYKWLAPIGFGLMFMLSVYASYGMRERLIFNRVDLQTLSFFFIGTIASMIGMVLGHALFADQKSKEKSK